MKVAVVGGGYTGLSAAVRLVEAGVEVTVFEADESAGGLAKGFTKNGWRWYLEDFYHHIFTNDTEIIELAKKVGAKILIKNPVSTSFLKGKEVTLDSPLSLLRFSQLSLTARIHMGVGLALLKLVPNGTFLEKYQADVTLPYLLGKQGYEMIWKKLLKAKFGPHMEKVNLAWFWSRVKKRTKKLGYFEGGFNTLVLKMSEYIRSHKGTVLTKTKVISIKETGSGVEVNGVAFDAAIITTPATQIQKMFPAYAFPAIDYLWSQVLVLETAKKFMRGYWMNVLEDKFPFLVAVEHTNMVDKKYYGNNRVLYLGNYLPEGDKRLKMSKDQLIELYLPYLRKINKKFNRKGIKSSELFQKPFSQPVFPINYSKMRPSFKIGKKVYMANMSMVYPFDRGTNYAVKIGGDVADLVIKNLNKHE